MGLFCCDSLSNSESKDQNNKKAQNEITVLVVGDNQVGK